MAAPMQSPAAPATQFQTPNPAPANQFQSKAPALATPVAPPITPVPQAPQPTPSPMQGVMNIIAPKAEAATPTPQPSTPISQASSGPTISKSMLLQMRQTMDDSVIMHTIYHSDPSFKAKVDMMQPFYEKQDAGWQTRFPTLALNKYYNINPDLPSSPDVNALAQTMTNPAAQQPSWWQGIYDMANAPMATVGGLMDKGIGAVQQGIGNGLSALGAQGLGQKFQNFGQGMENQPEAQQIGQNAQKTVENLPNYAMMIAPEVAPEMGLAGLGRFAKPVASAIGAGVAQGATESIKTAEGENTNSPLEQAGNIGKEALLGGVTQAGSQMLSGAASKAASYMSDALPARMVNSVLRPVSKEFDFGKNPGQSVVDEGLTAPTRASLLPKITARKQEIGQSLGSIIEGASKGPNTPQIDMSKSILKPIQDAMLKARQNGETQLFNSLNDLKDGLTKNFVQKDGTIVAAGDKGLVQTPLGVWQQKQAVGNAMRWTGQAFDKDLNQVKLQIFQNLKNDLVKAVPESKDLMTRYSGMLGAENSLQRTIQIAEHHNMMGFGDKTAGIAGAALGLLHGGPEGGAIGSAAGIALSKAAGSTATKTIGAQALSKVSPAVQKILSGLSSLAPEEKAIILKTLSGESNVPPATTP